MAPVWARRASRTGSANLQLSLRLQQQLQKDRQHLNDKRNNETSRRFTMSEEELQVLITLDDPEFGPEEDTFNHQQARNTLEYPPGQQRVPDQRSDPYIDLSR